MAAEMIDPIASDLVTYEEATRILNVTYGTLRSLVSLGHLRPVRIPGKVGKRLHRAELEAYRHRAHPRLVSVAPASDAPATSEDRGLRERVEALSGPTLDGWKTTAQSLTSIAIAAALGQAGGVGDPKVLSGLSRTSAAI